MRALSARLLGLCDFGQSAPTCVFKPANVVGQSVGAAVGSKARVQLAIIKLNKYSSAHKARCIAAVLGFRVLKASDTHQMP
jgi:hypothetical protein